MLVFATEFSTARNATADEFLKVCHDWLGGSSRYPWDSSSFVQPHPVNEIVTLEERGFFVSTALTDSGGARMAAMQHRYIDEQSLEWVTELVGRETAAGLLASVRVHCTALVAGAEIPWARKPYVIRQILARLGGGKDGEFTIGEEPKLLGSGDVEFARAAITGKLGSQLPVVYVSVGIDGHPQLNPNILARRLSGMAHVLVEPSRDFSYDLMPLVGGVNAYGGAIGLHWPKGVAFERTFVGPRGPKPTARFLESRVQTALCQSHPTDLSTWMAVRALVARERLTALRESGNDDVNDWIDAFDEERKSLQAQLDEAKTKNASLNAQLLGAQLSGTSGDLLAAGKEQDLFPGERAEIVQSTLRDALRNIAEDSRVNHVLRDLLPEDEGRTRAEHAESIKAALHDKMQIGSAEVAELIRLGFAVTDDGKHYKAVFGGDARYTFTLHKTASDHRSPKNLVSQISRRLFK